MAGLNYNELIITFPDGDEQDIAEENIVSESMRLTQSICDEDYLKFGGCIASEFRIDLLNTNERSFTQELTGCWISVKLIQHKISDRPIYPSSSLYPSGDLFPGFERDETVHYIFSGYIASAKLSENDMNVRTVIAYDALALLYESDATNYIYQTFLGTSGGELATTLGYILDSIRGKNNNGIIDIIPDSTGSSALSNRFLSDFYTSNNLRHRVTSFPNQNPTWNDNDNKISFGNLLKDLCEVVAVFGIMTPDSGKGKFKMIDLSGTPIVYDFYEKLQSEEYIATGYTELKFNIYTGDTARNGKNTLSGGIPKAYDGAVDKYYDFTDNMLINQPYNVVGGSRTTTHFEALINTSNIGYRIAMNPENGDCAFSSYRPLKATVEGTPEQIVGKPITIIANKTNPDGSYIEQDGEYIKEEINSYVFKRTLSGIQALTDEIEVKGQR